jgi:superfamily II DNA helicase RecQ
MKSGVFNFLALDRVHFGVLAAEALQLEITQRASQRIFMVTSRTLNRTTPAVTDLAHHLGNQVVGVFDECVEHTPRTSVIALAAALREAQADLVVSVGGGTVIDTAKIALLCLAEGIHHADDLDHKNRLLDAVLATTGMEQAIIFMSTKLSTEDQAGRLREAGHAVAALHGDLPQHARNRVVRMLLEGRIQIVVATDVAARGIDVPTISHVINFDLPMKAEDYVHRIGRTARAGRAGISVSFDGRADRSRLFGI